MAGRIDGCPLAWPRRSWASVAPCATFEIGRIAGKGTHTENPASPAHAWLAPGAMLRLSILANDFINVEAEGGGARPLARYRFYFSPDTPAYDVPPVSWNASVGATLRLP
jgi:hypothetical protein